MNVKEAAERAGVSVRTLHYYEEARLIHPRRNPENDYRIYSEADVRRARLARTLREMQISLKDVAKLLDASPAERNAFLELQRNQLIEQRQKLDNRIALLDGLRMIGLSRAESLRCASIDDEMDRAREVVLSLPQFQSYPQRLDALSESKQAALVRELLARFADLARGEPAASADALRQCIEAHFFPCSDEYLLAFGRMLGGDGCLGLQIDADFGSGTAARALEVLESFLRDASKDRS